jgi:DNA invertase Pin-like site-specific DNA recombinase
VGCGPRGAGLGRGLGHRLTRAALYARVSTNDKGQDTETQLVPLRRVAEGRGWEATEYVDEGVSGSTASRPALDRLLADVRAGRVDVVVVARFDRFARSTSHLLSALDEFRSMGVDFVSMNESIDTSTPVGRMVFTLVAAVAEFEREIIRERVVSGVRRAQANGKHCGRPKVELDLRPAVAMLEQGHGLKAIASALGVSRSTLRRRLIEADAWRTQ